MRKLTVLFSAALLFSSHAAAFDLSHSKFTSILKKVNVGGLIDYLSLKKDPTDLNAYLKSLAEVEKDNFEKWSQEDQIAFWINAYNAYTLKAIIDHYPIKSSFLKSALYPKNSIRQIDGVWDKLKWPVLGRKMTLNQIEHDTLRADFNEPNIHMALVCAAMSCPPLRDEAYVGATLPEQFDDQARVFLSIDKNFRVSKEEGVVFVSSIFKWFGEDFVQNFGGNPAFGNHEKTQAAFLNYIAIHIKGVNQQYMLSGDFDVEYLDYDWSLNEQP